MKSLINVLLELYESMVKGDLQLYRDYITIERRTRSEGLKFLTVTLPALGKTFDRALGDGLWQDSLLSFKADKPYLTPIFLRDLFRKVFDQEGKLLDSADPGAVGKIRQVCFFAYKLDKPHSADQEREVLMDFIVNESELCKLADEGRFDPDPILLMANEFTQQIFGNVERHYVPSHGPGVTSKGRVPNKHETKLSPGSPVYTRHGRSFWTSPDDGMTRLDRYPTWKPDDYFVGSWATRILFVPKDSRGPRLISCEPQEHMYIQQGIMRCLYSELEAHPLTGGQVWFSSNERHRQLAIEASRTREWSTLDLKDASDRVALRLVETLFAGTTLLPDMIACRTPATVYGPLRIEMSKWAPMGSALCFPILAYTCFILSYTSLVFSGVSPEDAKASVLVYGDDIIVRTEYAGIITRVLEYYGLKVNHSKSFVNSRFAESCGMDAFDGVQVTPSRLKKLWHLHKEIETKRPGAVTYHLVALANQLPAKYRHLRERLFALAEDICGRPLPWGLDLSYLCRICTMEELPHLHNAYLDQIGRNRKNRSFLAYRVVSRKTSYAESPYGRLSRILPLMGKDFALPHWGETVLPRDSVVVLRKTKLPVPRF